MEDPAVKRARLLENTMGKQGKVALGGANSFIVGGLHNDIDPKWFIQREKPIHRTMIEMSMAGYTNKEIATVCETSMLGVSNTLRQPFAREYIVKNTEKTLQEELRAFLEAEALPSLNVLKAVRDNDMAKPAERTSAANSLLDRFMGKPNQSVTVTEKPLESLSEDELATRTNAILNGFSRSNGVPTTPAS